MFFKGLKGATGDIVCLAFVFIPMVAIANPGQNSILEICSADGLKRIVIGPDGDPMHSLKSPDGAACHAVCTLGNDEEEGEGC